MTENKRMRAKAATVLEPDEQIIAIVQLIGAPGDQAGESIAENARQHRSTRGRYLSANDLDPQQGWQHSANEGLFALTDRRAVTFELGLSGSPKSVAWSAPAEGTTLGWADAKIKMVSYRMLHLSFSDGTWTVQFALRQGNFFRKVKSDETDLLIDALGSDASPVDIPPDD